MLMFLGRCVASQAIPSMLSEILNEVFITPKSSYYFGISAYLKLSPGILRDARFVANPFRVIYIASCRNTQDSPKG